MTALVDLHLHTTASDGRLTPTQLVELVVSRGLRVISISDHDSTEGLAEAFQVARSYPELTLIPGIELSTDIPRNEIHLLGYYIDYSDGGFQDTLREFRRAREERAQRMVEKLDHLGVHVEWNRVRLLAGEGAVGRPHIAQAMVEKGYVTYPQEAFATYIGRNGPAYAERPKLTPQEAVHMVVDVGGLPVMAHPAGVLELDDVVASLKSEGLVGMEVHYAEYSADVRQRLLEVAKRHALLPCGGSDYHAFGSPGEPQPGDLGPPLEVAHELMRLARERSRLSG